MSLALPKLVTNYLAAVEAKDTDMLALCFADDALVHDEGRDYRGLMPSGPGSRRLKRNISIGWSARRFSEQNNRETPCQADREISLEARSISTTRLGSQTTKLPHWKLDDGRTTPFPVDGNEFKGKRVLVTGGTKGMGEAMVRRLRMGGASVATTA